jgi:MFS family permease
VTDVLPDGILLGIGAGTALAPLLLGATSSVRQEEAGLASGMASTSFMLGGALGLAVLAGIATTRTSSLLAAGQGNLAALTSGYHAAFLGGASCAALAALLAACWLRVSPGQPADSATVTRRNQRLPPREVRRSRTETRESPKERNTR